MPPQEYTGLPDHTTVEIPDRTTHREDVLLSVTERKMCECFDSSTLLQKEESNARCSSHISPLRPKGDASWIFHVHGLICVVHHHPVHDDPSHHLRCNIREETVGEEHGGGRSLTVRPKGDPLSTINAVSLQPQQSQTFIELVYYYTLSRESTAKMKKPNELYCS